MLRVQSFVYSQTSKISDSGVYCMAVVYTCCKVTTDVTAAAEATADEGAMMGNSN